jgi:hypothetical protein
LEELLRNARDLVFARLPKRTKEVMLTGKSTKPARKKTPAKASPKAKKKK